MDHLPTSIEAYLEEAGFSGTEILILRRLMDGEPLTIRQLGAKTGKSTGVLDQAMKKLMQKNIIKKTLINDAPKYTLDTLETVLEWMQEDMEQKREMLLRRHQNFESFVTSLESGSKRPDIEYFEGDSGIKQAYIKLLNGPGEILHYLPVQFKEEEDPLRDFRVQYFRERQHRKMFSRVLAHDTPLGRRYQSRDAFEYRKTLLIPEQEYPFTFEKIITGDRIACFDHKARTACVIRYPELSDVERTLFEAIWRQTQFSVTAPKDGVQKDIVETKPERIAFSTATLSQVREFFLSPKSLVAFGICAFLALTTTYLLYHQSLETSKLRIQDRVKSIAATAALQFDARDIDRIWTLEDIHKPEYAKLIHHLNRIRRENEGVKYVYILRPTSELGVHRFVADADALDPFVVRDVNDDGVIDDSDHLSPPGELYREASFPSNQWFKLDKPASYDPATDQWGTFITGSAPIRNEVGEPVAIIGVDVEAGELYILTRSQFKSLLYFVGFFALFLVIRFAAFQPKTFLQVVSLSSMRRTAIFGISFLLIAVGLMIAMYWQKQKILQLQTGERLMAIAATAASQFDPNDLDELRFARDMRTPEYQRVFKKLNEIRDSNSFIKWIYILRVTGEENIWEFVADADMNFFLEGADDYNGDAEISEDEENVWPGRKYYSSWPTFQEALRKPSYSKAPEIDQWGTFITGAAPIKFNGETVGVLGIDVNIDSL